MCRYEAQCAQHDEVLASLPANLDLLARLEVHPAAQGPQLRRLVDFVPQERLKEWAGRCAGSRQSLAAKVCQQFSRQTPMQWAHSASRRRFECTAGFQRPSHDPCRVLLLHVSVRQHQLVMGKH